MHMYVYLFAYVQFLSESTTGGESITHNEQGLRGSIADRYVDHKRSELLSAIVDLELVSGRESGTNVSCVCSRQN